MGMPIQFLNGVNDNYTGAGKSSSKPYFREITKVTSGYDILSYAGNSSIEDEERLFTHVKRTLSAYKKQPELNQLLYNAERLTEYTQRNGAIPTMETMLQNVVDAWDTSERESVLRRQADIEERLILSNILNNHFYEDAWHIDNDDEYNQWDYDVNAAGKIKRKTNRNGFFALILAALYPDIADGEIDFVAANPFFVQHKTFQRAKIHALRKREKATSEKIEGICGLSGVDATYRKTLYGVASGRVLNATNNADFNVRQYLIDTLYLISNRPQDYFTSDLQAQTEIAYLQHLIKYFDTDLRNNVIAQLAATGTMTGQLAGGLGSIISFFKKLGKNIGEFFRKLGSKTFRGLVWNSLGKLVKIIIKFIIKYNPITILMRSAFLFMVNCNLFDLATNNFVGIQTRRYAIAAGYSDEQYDKAVKVWEATKSKYEKIGGDAENLKKTITRGASRFIAETGNVDAAQLKDKNWFERIIDTIFTKSPNLLTEAQLYDQAAETEKGQRNANGEIEDENLENPAEVQDYEEEADLDNDDKKNILVTFYNVLNIYLTFIVRLHYIRGWGIYNWEGSTTTTSISKKSRKLVDQIVASRDVFAPTGKLANNLANKTPEQLFDELGKQFTNIQIEVELVENARGKNIINPNTFYERFSGNDWLSETDATHLQAYNEVVIPTLEEMARVQAAKEEEEKQGLPVYQDFSIINYKPAFYKLSDAAIQREIEADALDLKQSPVSELVKSTTTLTPNTKLVAVATDFLPVSTVRTNALQGIDDVANYYDYCVAKYLEANPGLGAAPVIAGIAVWLSTGLALVSALMEIFKAFGVGGKKMQSVWEKATAFTHLASAGLNMYTVIAEATGKSAYEKAIAEGKTPEEAQAIADAAALKAAEDAKTADAAKKGSSGVPTSLADLVEQFTSGKIDLTDYTKYLEIFTGTTPSGT
ncbi:MAG: hypothetical protein LBV75_05965, partial [Paludibacter sp.]|nr:hypothetical protein [Paludibacter sp.]